MRLIIVMAIFLGALFAFGIPKANSEECVSEDNLLSIAEGIQDQNKGIPFWFGSQVRDGEHVVWVYFAGAPTGIHFFWKDGDCKARSINVPWMMIRIQMGEQEEKALRERYIKWRTDLLKPKATNT